MVATFATGVVLAAGCDLSPEVAAPSATHRSLSLAPQATCLLGPADACRGDERLDRRLVGTDLSRTTQVAGGRFHLCRSTLAGAVECWGRNREGQLGSPPTAEERCLGRRCRRGPVPVPGLEGPTTGLVAGAFHTCLLSSESEVLCWGDNRLGQLGRAAPGPTVAAVEGLPEAAVAIAAAELHSCAVLRGGGVACWGDGSEGQLGPAVTGPSSTPVAVPGLGVAAELALGAEHSCALLGDGSVECWGHNRFGQLGDGTTTNRSEPQPVLGLEAEAIQIVAGDTFTCARLKTGSVRCWGSHQLGQLGCGAMPLPPSGGMLHSPVPVAVALEAPVDLLVAAGDNACALAIDGEPWCWGANEHGQLADGTRQNRHAPVRWLGAEPPALSSERPRPGDGSLPGLDVSYHSGEIDWHGARTAGHHFGFTLATAGEDFRDPLLPSHWARLREAGLARGAYHFFVAADDPESQAGWFLSQLELEPGDLRPVVDVESLGADAPPDLADRLRRFVEVVEQETGAKPILYTGPTFWNRYLGEGFGDHPLWIAHYDVAKPQVPNGWQDWTLWQWRGDAAVRGVGAPVDLDRLVSGEALEALRIPVAAPP